MSKCTGSDRITALQVANDILKGYGDFVHLEPKEYTLRTLKLAGIFLEWADAENVEIQIEPLSKFFNH